MKTSEAAEFLNVSPTTLRAWEVRHGFPLPARTLGRHRIYDRSEIMALRRALEEGMSVASAIEKVRANLGIDESQLEAELRAFDAEGADRAMEAALAVRRLDRVVEDLLLPTLEVVHARSGEHGAVWAFAARWAREWLRRHLRLAPMHSRGLTLLVGDASGGELDPDGVAIAALELFCARAGARVLVLPVAAYGGLGDAAPTASAVVIAGGRAPGEELMRWLGAVRVTAGRVPLWRFRGGQSAHNALPREPLAAQTELFQRLASRSMQRRSSGG